MTVEKEKDFAMSILIGKHPVWQLVNGNTGKPFALNTDDAKKYFAEHPQAYLEVIAAKVNKKEPVKR